MNTTDLRALLDVVGPLLFLSHIYTDWNVMMFLPYHPVLYCPVGLLCLSHSISPMQCNVLYMGNIMPECVTGMMALLICNCIVRVAPAVLDGMDMHTKMSSM